MNEPINYGGRSAATGELPGEELRIQDTPKQNVEVYLAPILEPKAPLIGNSGLDKAAIFGVGINGVDERHLNALDRSSLMDYDEEGGGPDREADIEKSLLIWDETAMDSFDESSEFNSGGFYRPVDGAGDDLMDENRPVKTEAF